MKLKYRLFFVRNMPFGIEIPPVAPKRDENTNTELLKTPVGIATDNAEPRFSGNKALIRGGQVIYVRASNPRKSTVDGRQYVD